MPESSPQILYRNDWGARGPARTLTNLTPSHVKYCVLHWPGSKGSIGTTRSTIDGYLRAWQSMHIYDRGWKDIAYNIGVDLLGRIYILRGWDKVDGSVKNMGGEVVSILAILGTNDKPTTPMLNSIAWVQNNFDKLLGKKLTRTYHGKLRSTDCPGPNLTKWAKEGFPMNDTPPIVTPPVTPAPPVTSAPTSIAFRFGTWNCQMPNLGGSSDWKSRAAFVHDTMRVSVLAVQECSEAGRDAFRAALGKNWLTYPLSTSQTVALLWDSSKYQHRDPRRHSLGTRYHGGIAVPLIPKGFTVGFDAVSYHGPVRGTLADKRLALANTRKSIVKSWPTIFAGDTNMNDPVLSGFSPATPHGLDTMPRKPGVQSYDQILVKNLVIRGYEMHTSPLSDHAALVAQLTYTTDTR